MTNAKNKPKKAKNPHKTQKTIEKILKTFELKSWELEELFFLAFPCSIKYFK